MPKKKKKKKKSKSNKKKKSKRKIISKTRNNVFEINVIPHTLKLTNLNKLKINDLVNVELDIFSKYIYKYSN